MVCHPLPPTASPHDVLRSRLSESLPEDEGAARKVSEALEEIAGHRNGGPAVTPETRYTAGRHDGDRRKAVVTGRVTIPPRR